MAKISKTATQLRAEANKLLSLAKEREKEDLIQIGEFILKLYKNNKVTDTKIENFIKQILGEGENKTSEGEPHREIVKNASY